MDLSDALNRFRSPLVGLITFWGATPADAVEIAQDSFAEAWLNRDNCNGDCGDPQVFGAWLNGVALNCYRNHTRSRRRREGRVSSVEPEVLDRTVVETKVVSDERLERLRYAIRLLPDKQREVVLMHYLDETSVNDVAALLSVAQTKPESMEQLTLCPGEHTTATLLFRLFYANSTRLEHVVFSEIMPRLKDGTADFGVCIHEGRFTWEAQGLSLVEDLGLVWESETGCPLPLGGLIGRRDLTELQKVQQIIRESIEYGLAHREETLPTMRKYAQEFDDSVLMKHVELYVNDWTIDLGEEGSRALNVLNERARVARVVREDAHQLEIFGS